MSALEFLIDEAARHGIPKDRIKEAREELELLREEAFERARDILKQGQTGMTQYVPERVTSILRTDPERAREMGLGWAL